MTVNEARVESELEAVFVRLRFALHQGPTTSVSVPMQRSSCRERAAPLPGRRLPPPRGADDLVVGFTACSAEQSNNHTFKPIEYEIGRA